MKRRIIAGLSLSTILVVSLVVFLSNKEKENVKVEGYNAQSSLPTTIDLNDTSAANIRSYYSSLNNLSTSERQGTNLLKNLKTILKNGQKYYSYDSGSAIWQIYEIADRDWSKSPASGTTYGTYNSSTNKITNYTYGTSTSNGKNNPYLHALYFNRNITNQVRAWDDHQQDEWGINREHVWAKAEGFENSGAGGARGDPMHLMAGAGYSNNIHSNYFYGYVNTSSSYTNCGTKYSNQTGNLMGKSKTLGGTTSVFEPQDCDKGDIARAIFYMVARYNYLSGSDSDGISSDNPNLTLSQSLSDWASSGYQSTTSNPGKMGILTDLLAWHHADPVDEFEIHRNNLLYTNYTNNRNPFIDFPEWVDFIWGTAVYNETSYQSYSSTPTGYATPSTDIINGYNPSGTISVTDVSLDTTSVTLSTGSVFQLNKTITPANATNQNVTWTSNRTSVATVSSTGLVTAVATGNATITVKTADGNKTATCAVTVQSGSIAVTGVSVSPSTLTLEPGNYDTLTATVSPNNATNKTVTWSSGNTSVATVNSSGVVTGVSNGTAVITATTQDGGYTAICTVTVSENEQPIEATITKDDYTPGYDGTSGTSGTISKTIASANDLSISYAGINTKSSGGTAYAYTMYFGGNGYIYSTSCPSGYYPSNVTVTFSSSTGTSGKAGITFGSNTITNKQTVTGAVSKNGTCSLDNNDSSKVYWNFSTNSANVQVASILLTYTPISSSSISVTGVTLNKSSLSLMVGDSETLVATVEPTNADNLDVEWDSSDADVADVDSSGLVTAVATGSATITVTTDDGGFTASCTVTVSQVTGITAVVKSDRTFYVGETITKSNITVTTNLGTDVTNSITFNEYQFTYSDAPSGGATAVKQFAITYESFETTLSVNVQRQARTALGSFTDVLNRELTGISGTSYSAWSNKKSNSNAVYAGQSAGGNDSIQLRSTSPSGIVTTSSGGTIVSITVVWNSNTSNGRTINIYGKTTAYSSSSDLYGNSTAQGTLLGSIAKGTSTSLTIEGFYTFIGIRSSGSALYLDQITINYKQVDSAKNVANYIMYEDTNNQCTTKTTVAIGYFNGLSADERSTFMSSNDYVITTARERFNAWLAHEGKTIASSNSDYVIQNRSVFIKLIGDSQETTNTVLIIAVSVLVGLSFAGYLFIRKKKEN